MSEKKIRTPEDIIREHIVELEKKREKILKQVESNASINKKIDLYMVAEHINVSIRNLYICIGKIASEAAAQEKGGTGHE